MAYEKVQFIAHCIYTGSNWVWDKISGTWKEEYVGLPDPKEDINARVALVQAAMETAWRHSGGRRYSDTLIIFMMPEFFFRGKEGAYSAADTIYLIERLKELVKDERWQHWIFVFGSIVGALATSNQTSFVLNFTLVQRGGLDAFKFDRERIIPKIFKAPADFIGALNLKDRSQLSSSNYLSENVSHPLTTNEYKLWRVLEEFVSDDSVETEKLLGFNDLRLLQEILKIELNITGYFTVIRLIRAIDQTAPINQWLKSLFLKVNHILALRNTSEKPKQTGDFQEVWESILKESSNPTFTNIYGNKKLKQAYKPEEFTWDSFKQVLKEKLQNEADKNNKSTEEILLQIKEDTSLVFRREGVNLENEWQAIIKKLITDRIAKNKLAGGVKSPEAAKIETQALTRKLLDELFKADPREIQDHLGFYDLPVWIEMLRFLKDKIDIYLFLRPAQASKEDMILVNTWFPITKGLLKEYLTISQCRDKLIKKNIIKPEDTQQELLSWKSDSHFWIQQYPEEIKKIIRSPNKYRELPFVFELKDFYSSHEKEFKNITFGLEICRDHGENVLKEALKSFSQAQQPSIDILLIPSAGTIIQPENVVVRNRGYVFNCDGYHTAGGSSNKISRKEPITFQAPDPSKTAVREPHSDLQKNVPEEKKKNVPEEKKKNVPTLERKYTGETIEIFYSSKVTELEISLPRNIRISQIYPQGAGNIHLYPVCPLDFAQPVSTSKSIFPDSNLVGAMSNEPVLLNGMKVIFDQPVAVSPVTLEAKDQERQHESH